MRCSRLFVFFLTFSFILLSFTLPAAAASSENLVNPFLEQWEHTASGVPGSSPSGNTYMHVVKHQMPGSSQITYALRPSYVGSTGSDGSTKLYYGYMFDKNSLKSGNSYTFSMHIPSPDEIRANTTYLWDDAGFASRMGDGFIFCFGTIDSTGQNFTPLVEFLSLTTENYLSLAGTDYVSSFECPDYSGGNPCLYIIAMNVGSTSLLFLDDSMQLIDNAAEEEEGFFSRIFEFFELKFKKIGDWFTDLSDDFDDAINGLLQSIGGEFQKFGNLFLYLEYTDTPPENPFDTIKSPLDSLEAAFDAPLCSCSDGNTCELCEGDSVLVKGIKFIRSIPDALTTVLDSITAGIHIFDLFTSKFGWLKALCMFTLALIVVTRFIGL